MDDNVRVTIARRTSNASEDDRISIKVSGVNGLTLVEVLMSLKEFAYAITGMGQSKGSLLHLIDSADIDHVFDDKEIKVVTIAAPLILASIEERRRCILKMLEEERYLTDGWAILNDGLRQQQPIADKHQVTLYRYVKSNDIC